eukprot:1175969-Prorocentrum_minimum.AAC.4
MSHHVHRYSTLIFGEHRTLTSNLTHRSTSLTGHMLVNMGLDTEYEMRRLANPSFFIEQFNGGSPVPPTVRNEPFD